MLNHNGNTYHTIFFDFDGVIADTNGIKMENIRHAVALHADPKQTDAFVQYFISNSGIPREKKIYSRFDRRTGEQILEEYNHRNVAAFRELGTTRGFTDFLDLCTDSGAAVYVLSGGDADEIRRILRNNGLADRFDGILAGPDTKSEHLSGLDFKKPALFIGDSRHDYEVAALFGLDFVFMSDYTQFEEWREFFRANPCHQIVTNFKEML